MSESVQFYKVNSEFTVITETGLQTLAMETLDKVCKTGTFDQIEGRDSQIRILFVQIRSDSVTNERMLIPY